ncbi:uncharacterized protein N0V89_002296 [Didymosphaeria variabile]|uniref:Carboxylic ester hydrolase n=1 Tax=Didymosphaeria variabile TaxID=1932322 RepID=A0A9W8XU43_9PLEO|nr:uncharacterized protein N0V89_002296 [Didymosphaeria variabile]KAJ4357720.1 hypothetical protein N0V89_002296 [Didymosphaeria variabile]
MGISPDGFVSYSQLCKSVKTPRVMVLLCGLATMLLVQAITAIANPATSPSIARCSTLNYVSLKQFNASVINATYHATKSFNVSATFNDIPFCELQAQISYGTGSSLSFAVWMPDEFDYQHRFLAVGNGGFAGTLDTVSMMKQFNAGLALAVAGGNGGHEAGPNTGTGYLPFMHDPDQIRAWIHNGISIFTHAAKHIVEAYYGTAAKRSYYVGCSTGGAQGYALAQYHPHLFDGIYAGSPGFWYSHLMLSFLWNTQRTNVSDGCWFLDAVPQEADSAQKTTATNLTQTQLNLTNQAVLDACDALDGVQDRLIENPLQCSFSINSLACGGSAHPDRCLTPDQIEAAKLVYLGPGRADNEVSLYPGFSFGSESEWLLQEGSLGNEYAVPLLRNMVFDDLDWDPATFDWSSDVDLVNSRASVLIDSISTNLSTYRRTGCKFLTSQGWADPYNAGKLPVLHMEKIESFFEGGRKRLLSAIYEYHYLEPLIEWVETGTPPGQLVSSNPPDGSERTRKLCPWPETAHLVGENPDDWENYHCE